MVLQNWIRIEPRNIYSFYLRKLFLGKFSSNNRHFLCQILLCNNSIKENLPQIKLTCLSKMLTSDFKEKQYKQMHTLLLRYHSVYIYSFEYF